ncbi:MAG: hypothetical protein ABIJ97_10725 [Bacteroidota bacterium]
MAKIPAKIITLLFHPMIMPTLGIFIILNSGTYISTIHSDAQKFIYLIVFACTFIFPLLFFPFLLYRNLVTSFSIHNHKERIYPLILALIFYLIAYYVIQSLPFPSIFSSFLLACLISLSVVLIISIFWKISIHMCGIGGIIGLLLSISINFLTNLQFYLIIAFIIAGLTAYSRLKLNEHNYQQVVAGFSIGFVVVFLTVLFF